MNINVQQIFISNRNGKDGKIGKNPWNLNDGQPVCYVETLLAWTQCPERTYIMTCILLFNGFCSSDVYQTRSTVLLGRFSSRGSVTVGGEHWTAAGLWWYETQWEDYFQTNIPNVGTPQTELQACKMVSLPLEQFLRSTLEPFKS